MLASRRNFGLNRRIGAMISAFAPFPPFRSKFEFHRGCRQARTNRHWTIAAQAQEYREGLAIEKFINEDSAKRSRGRTDR